MRKISKSNYEIVSVGQNCLPRLYLTRNFLKKTKKMGELSMPFDLATHSLLSVIDFIKTDFKNFFDWLTYMDTIEMSCWINEKYQNRYNHDSDCSKNERSKFITRFEKRINNFRNVIKSDKFVFFVLASYSNKAEEVNRLYSIIKEIRGDKPFKLLVADLELTLDDNVNKEISVHKPKYHFSELPDWKTLGSKSRKRKQVEKDFVSFVKSGISKYFKVQVFKPKLFDYEGKAMYKVRKITQNLFSITNENSHKRITILGVKLKVKKYIKKALLSK